MNAFGIPGMLSDFSFRTFNDRLGSSYPVKRLDAISSATLCQNVNNLLTENSRSLIFPMTGTEVEGTYITGCCCGQTAGWINMPLGMEVGLVLGDIVLDGDPVPTQRDSAPIFGPCLLWQNCCMDQDSTWCGGTPRPRRHCTQLILLFS